MRFLSAGVLALGLCACDAVFPVGGGTVGGDGPVGPDGVGVDASGDAGTDAVTTDDAGGDARPPNRCSTITAQFCADFDTPTTGLSQMTLFAAPDPPATMYETPGGPASFARSYVPGLADSIAIASAQINTVGFAGQIWVWNYATVAAGCLPYVLWVDFDPNQDNRILLTADTTGYTLWLQATDGAGGTTLQPVSVTADPSSWNRILIQVDAVNGTASLTIGTASASVIAASFSQAAGYSPVVNIGQYISSGGPDCYAGFDDLEVYY